MPKEFSILIEVRYFDETRQHEIDLLIKPPDVDLTTFDTQEVDESNGSQSILSLDEVSEEEVSA